MMFKFFLIAFSDVGMSKINLLCALIGCFLVNELDLLYSLCSNCYG